MKLGHSSWRVFKSVVFCPNFLDVFGILYSYGFGQISEAFGIVQIQFWTCVIDYDPWEYGVLGQIVEGATSNGV